MTVDLHAVLKVCRWCGEAVPESSDPLGRGRPATFCSDEHRAVYRASFGAALWRGPVMLRAEGLPEALAETVIAGPVFAPGVWVQGWAACLETLLGGPVTVTAERVESLASDTGGSR